MVTKLYFGNHFSYEMLDPSIREELEIEPFHLKSIQSNHFSCVGCGFLGTQEESCPEGSVHLDKGDVLYIRFVDESLLDGYTPLSKAVTGIGVKIYLPR